MKDWTTEVQNRLRTLIDEQGGISSFARYIGLSKQVVGFWYNGNRTPDVKNLVLISEKCNVYVDWLIGNLPQEMRTIELDKRIAQKYTGLSDGAIQVLKQLTETKPKEESGEVEDIVLEGNSLTLSLISHMIEDERFLDVVQQVKDAISFSSKVENEKTIQSAGIRFYADLSGIDLKEVHTYKALKQMDGIITDLIQDGYEKEM